DVDASPSELPRNPRAPRWTGPRRTIGTGRDPREPQAAEDLHELGQPVLEPPGHVLNVEAAEGVRDGGPLEVVIGDERRARADGVAPAACDSMAVAALQLVRERAIVAELQPLEVVGARQERPCADSRFNPAASILDRRPRPNERQPDELHELGRR